MKKNKIKNHSNLTVKLLSLIVMGGITPIALISAVSTSSDSRTLSSSGGATNSLFIEKLPINSNLEKNVDSFINPNSTKSKNTLLSTNNLSYSFKFGEGLLDSTGKKSLETNLRKKLVQVTDPQDDNVSLKTTESIIKAFPMGGNDQLITATTDSGNFLHYVNTQDDISLKRLNNVFISIPKSWNNFSSNAINSITNENQVAQYYQYRLLEKMQINKFSKYFILTENGSFINVNENPLNDVVNGIGKIKDKFFFGKDLKSASVLILDNTTGKYKFQQEIKYNGESKTEKIKHISQIGFLNFSNSYLKLEKQEKVGKIGEVNETNQNTIKNSSLVELLNNNQDLSFNEERFLVKNWFQHNFFENYETLFKDFSTQSFLAKILTFDREGKIYYVNEYDIVKTLKSKLEILLGNYASVIKITPTESEDLLDRAKSSNESLQHTKINLDFDFAELEKLLNESDLESKFNVGTVQNYFTEKIANLPKNQGINIFVQFLDKYQNYDFKKTGDEIVKTIEDSLEHFSFDIKDQDLEFITGSNSELKYFLRVPTQTISIVNKKVILKLLKSFSFINDSNNKGKTYKKLKLLSESGFYFDLKDKNILKVIKEEEEEEESFVKTLIKNKLLHDISKETIESGITDKQFTVSGNLSFTNLPIIEGFITQSAKISVQATNSGGTQSISEDINGDISISFKDSKFVKQTLSDIIKNKQFYSEIVVTITLPEDYKINYIFTNSDSSTNVGFNVTSTLNKYSQNVYSKTDEQIDPNALFNIEKIGKVSNLHVTKGSLNLDLTWAGKSVTELKTIDWNNLQLFLNSFMEANKGDTSLKLMSSTPDSIIVSKFQSAFNSWLDENPLVLYTEEKVREKEQEVYVYKKVLIKSFVDYEEHKHKLITNNKNSDNWNVSLAKFNNKPLNYSQFASFKKISTNTLLFFKNILKLTILDSEKTDNDSPKSNTLWFKTKGTTTYENTMIDVNNGDAAKFYKTVFEDQQLEKLTIGNKETELSFFEILKLYNAISGSYLSAVFSVNQDKINNMFRYKILATYTEVPDKNNPTSVNLVLENRLISNQWLKPSPNFNIIAPNVKNRLLDFKLNLSHPDKKYQKPTFQNQLVLGINSEALLNNLAKKSITPVGLISHPQIQDLWQSSYGITLFQFIENVLKKEFTDFNFQYNQNINESTKVEIETIKNKETEKNNISNVNNSSNSKNPNNSNVSGEVDRNNFELPPEIRKQLDDYLNSIPKEEQNKADEEFLKELFKNSGIDLENLKSLSKTLPKTTSGTVKLTNSESLESKDENSGDIEDKTIPIYEIRFISNLIVNFNSYWYEQLKNPRNIKNTQNLDDVELTINHERGVWTKKHTPKRGNIKVGKGTDIRNIKNEIPLIVSIPTTTSENALSTPLVQEGFKRFIIDQIFEKLKNQFPTLQKEDLNINPMDINSLRLLIYYNKLDYTKQGNEEKKSFEIYDRLNPLIQILENKTDNELWDTLISKSEIRVTVSANFLTEIPDNVKFSGSFSFLIRNVVNQQGGVIPKINEMNKKHLGVIVNNSTIGQYTQLKTYSLEKNLHKPFISKHQFKSLSNSEVSIRFQRTNNMISVSKPYNNLFSTISAKATEGSLIFSIEKSLTNEEKLQVTEMKINNFQVILNNSLVPFTNLDMKINSTSSGFDIKFTGNSLVKDQEYILKNLWSYFSNPIIHRVIEKQRDPKNQTNTLFDITISFTIGDVVVNHTWEQSIPDSDFLNDGEDLPDIFSLNGDKQQVHLYPINTSKTYDPLIDNREVLFTEIKNLNDDLNLNNFEYYSYAPNTPIDSKYDNAHEYVDSNGKAANDNWKINRWIQDRHYFRNPESKQIWKEKYEDLKLLELPSEEISSDGTKDKKVSRWNIYDSSIETPTLLTDKVGNTFGLGNDETGKIKEKIYFQLIETQRKPIDNIPLGLEKLYEKSYYPIISTNWIKPENLFYPLFNAKYILRNKPENSDYSQLTWEELNNPSIINLISGQKGLNINNKRIVKLTKSGDNYIATIKILIPINLNGFEYEKGKYFPNTLIYTPFYYNVSINVKSQQTYALSIKDNEQNFILSNETQLNKSSDESFDMNEIIVPSEKNQEVILQNAGVGTRITSTNNSDRGKATTSSNILTDIYNQNTSKGLIEDFKLYDVNLNTQDASTYLLSTLTNQESDIKRKNTIEGLFLGIDYNINLKSKVLETIMKQTLPFLRNTQITDSDKIAFLQSLGETSGIYWKLLLKQEKIDEIKKEIKLIPESNNDLLKTNQTSNNWLLKNKLSNSVNDNLTWTFGDGSIVLPGVILTKSKPFAFYNQETLVKNEEDEEKTLKESTNFIALKSEVVLSESEISEKVEFIKAKWNNKIYLVKLVDTLPENESFIKVGIKSNFNTVDKYEIDSTQLNLKTTTNFSSELSVNTSNISSLNLGETIQNNNDLKINDSNFWNAYPIVLIKGVEGIQILDILSNKLYVRINSGSGEIYYKHPTLNFYTKTTATENDDIFLTEVFYGENINDLVLFTQRNVKSVKEDVFYGKHSVGELDGLPSNYNITTIIIILVSVLSGLVGVILAIVGFGIIRRRNKVEDVGVKSTSKEKVKIKKPKK